MKKKSTPASLKGKRPTRVWLHGESGRMGHEIREAIAARSREFVLVGGSGRKIADSPRIEDSGAPARADVLARNLADVDLVLDFSMPEANSVLLEALGQRRKSRGPFAVVVGTTGLTPAQIAPWRKVAERGEFPVLIAPNTSIGVLVALKTAILASGILLRAGFDVEIVETHHRAKKDAPSGTARFLAKGVASEFPDDLRVTEARTGARKSGELGVHAVRGGGVFGEHEIRFLGDAEELKISHRAFSRALFASGALVLGNWVLAQGPGLFHLQDVQSEDLV